MPKLAAFFRALGLTWLADKINPPKPPSVVPQSKGGPGPVDPGKVQ